MSNANLQNSSFEQNLPLHVLYRIKTLSAHSDHCRAIGYRIGVAGGPGRNGRCPGETKRIWPYGYPSAQGNWSAPPPDSVGHQLPGGDVGFTSYPVDVVHQAQIT